LEVERQWRAHPGLRLPARIGAWHAIERHAQVLVDRYYDTPELQLHEQRMRLRVRRSHERAVSTLKRRLGSASGLRRRIEIEGPCEGDPEISLAFVAARLVTLEPLREFGTIVTRRTTSVYELDRRRIEVVRDHVSYPAGSDEWRLEAEGLPDDVNELAALLETLPLGLAPVRRGKVQTLLKRCA
jgi:inorganic triphosphatase YgiF